MNRPKLSDILRSAGAENIVDLWNTTEAAEDYRPIPAGTYTCHLIDGQLSHSRNGTPNYKGTFKVVDGPHSGRRLWWEIWLTQKAMAMAKRDLAKLGIHRPEQMEQPVPQWLRCRVVVVIHADDNGTDRNRIRDVEVIGRDTPEADPFAPSETTGGQL
jgi:hypothetical protein